MRINLSCQSLNTLHNDTRMKFLSIFPVLLLLGLAATAPTSNDDTVIITEEFFPESLSVYTSEHDIVSIVVPLNALNFDADEDEDTNDDEDGSTIFFVEADISDNGDRVDKGLYVLKNGQPKKLLDNGRDAAAANDDTKLAYFAAKDGIYVYNVKENTAEKYDSVTDNLIGIAKENGTDAIYVLNEYQQVYKVFDDGKQKVKVDQIQNAQQIVLDYSNNLYYYNDKKEVYVLGPDGVKAIIGLPENPTYLTLVRPPFVIEDGIPVVVDNKAYVVYANGSNELVDFEFKVRPSAYGMEATLIQYYAYDSKIYEYNLLAIILSDVLDELKGYLNDKKESIQSIATRSRTDLKA